MAVTPIQILAAGTTGTEDVALEINGTEVQRWNDIAGDFAGRQFVALDYTHPTSITADDVAVRFVGGDSSAADLRVDGVLVDGTKFESESVRTWSTGGWHDPLQAIAPRFGNGSLNDDRLFRVGGAFYYSASAGSTVEVFAAGATGEEDFWLTVNGQTALQPQGVGGDYANRQFVRYAYDSPDKVAPEDVRITFVNDLLIPGVSDRNLRIDAIAIDGRRYETEAPGTFSTGTYFNGGIQPGFPESESLHALGRFEYSSLGEDGTSAVGSRLVIDAVGTTFQEEIGVNLDGRLVSTIDRVGLVDGRTGSYADRDFKSYGVAHPRPLQASDIELEFLNDGEFGGIDKNVRIDAIELDGVRYETEDISTFSSGTWLPGRGALPGFVQDERLHINGGFQYGQDPAEAGVLSLGATSYEVSEDGGFVDIEFVRSASRGAVTLDYTTIDGTALAGEDYTARAGTVVLGPGELSTTVRVPILNDTEEEGTHTFNVAGDRVTGGASLNQPRTTTVTILDDDAPNLGNGIGLLGEYFIGQDFDSAVLERTDATIDFDWGPGSPSPEVPVNDFSVRWTGQIETLYSETYTFETRTDDGVRLWVNGVQLIDRWVDQSATAHSGTITLQAGELYDIRLEMYENAGDAVAELRWSSPSQAIEIVPASQLYSTLVIPDNGQFVGQTIISGGLFQPTAIDFARIGGADYMYISQQNGLVRLAIDGVLQSGSVVDFREQVNGVRDRGLLGMVVHPDLSTNPYLYLLYTYDPPEAQGQSGLAAPDAFGNRVSRLSRLTLDAADDYRSVLAGSEVVLLGTGSTWANISSPDKDSTQDLTLPPSGLLPNGEWVEDILVTDSQSHTIGALDFGPDGSLYVTNGDGTSYGRVDPRTTRVQDLDSLSGKVLRIDPLTGDGYSDNPFYTGDVTDDRSKVYNYGLRNPFRLAVDPTSGIPYVGDVGWTKWEEINGGRGENFGWPYYEGGASNGTLGGDGLNRQTGGYKDLPEAQAFYANGGDTLAKPPIWSRSHDAGGIAIALGDFYTGDIYPDRFDNALFFTDFGESTIRAITLDGTGGLDQSLVVMGSVGQVIEMSMGPDGRMYYVERQGNIGRIDYVAPTAASAGLSLARATAASTLETAAIARREPILSWLDGDLSASSSGRQVFRPSARGSLSGTEVQPASARAHIENDGESPDTPLIALAASSPSTQPPTTASSSSGSASVATSEPLDQAFALLLIEDTPFAANSDEIEATHSDNAEEAREESLDIVDTLGGG